MQELDEKQKFIHLIKNLFSEGLNDMITEHTHFKSLKEWTSLQTMIVVNEIDQQYNVILSVEDFLTAQTFGDLYHLIKSKRI
jgi:acyl carrier protein